MPLSRQLSAVVIAAAILVCPSLLHAGPPDVVRVGAPGNQASPEQQGSVAYEFVLGRCEVTNDEYATFLNATARVGDPHDLYSPLMSQHFWGGIERFGEPGRFHYSSKPGYGRLPVTFVSWWDAARYVNWLHFDRPDRGRSELGTTEGTNNSGAYDTRDELLAVRRNKEARFYLPNRDEWTKAAFFHERPGGGVWWRSATHESELPVAGPPDNERSNANYFDGRWAVPFPHLSPVGAYRSSPGPWGTYDQAGNVHEWAEDAPTPFTRRLLGGALFLYAIGVERGYAEAEIASQGLGSVGFRIAAPWPVPPPGQAVSPTPEPPRAGASSPAAPPSAEFMRFVLVDQPGNRPDPLYARGAVAFTFEIGEHEITNAQYTAFLNAVAATDDPFELWHPDMETGVVGAIVRRTESNGALCYAVRAGWERRPATYLSWYRLARFANWMHFGRPMSGRSELGTTEGDDRQGAYDTRAFPAPGEPPRYESQPARRNAGAKYWIPNQDEWYKAAYYDPTRLGERKYWDYATRSCTAPRAEPPPGGENSAGYLARDRLALGPPYYLAEADAYQSRSFFRTVGQAGGVWEWLEDWKAKGDSEGWRGNEWTRGLRGGSFGYNEIGLHAMNTDPGEPSHAYFVYGGRLARAAAAPVTVTPSLKQRVSNWVQGTPRASLTQQVFLLGFFSAVVATGSVGAAGALWMRWRASPGRRKMLPIRASGDRPR